MDDRMVQIKKNIDDNDVVSFDIFDTLIFRNIHQPKDIFRILAKEVKAKYGVDNFFDIRVNSESRARLDVKNQEVNFEEIYTRISKQCTFPIEKVKKRELEIEYEFISVNPFMKEAYDYARERNKRILYISDMYLPSDYVRTLLKKCGYGDEKIFLSNEYRANKGKTDLYEIARKEYSIDKNKWFHIGDNPISDYEKAVEYGIHAFLYKKVSTYKEWTKALTIGEAIIAGIQNNYLYNGMELDYWSEFGAKYVSTIYFGFTKWLYDLTKTENNVYFFARDGYAIKKIYDRFCALNKNRIFTKYLWCSRRVLQLPAMAEFSSMEQAVKELTIRKKHDAVISLRNILENAQITDWESAESIVKAFGFMSLDDEVTEENHYLAQKMAAKLSDNMKNNILNEKDKCLQYLKQEKVMDWEYINVVDIGWRGSCQDALEQLTGKKVKGYYFGTIQEAKQEKFCDMFGWCFDFGIPYDFKDEIFNYAMMYEFLFSAPHGSVIGYKEENDGRVSPVLNEDEHFNSVVEAFQKTAILLCEKYLQYASYMDIIGSSFCTEQYREFLSAKKRKDLEKFKNLYNDYLIGSTEKCSYITALSKEDFRYGNWKRLTGYSPFWREAFYISDANMYLNSDGLLTYGKCSLEKYLEYKLEYAKIYLDFGSGYNEDDTIIIKMRKKQNCYAFELEAVFDAKNIRIDPIEYHLIEVKSYKVRINGKEAETFVPEMKSFPRNGYKKIQTKDPYFEVNAIKEPVRTISFFADMKIVD